MAMSSRIHLGASKTVMTTSFPSDDFKILTNPFKPEDEIRRTADNSSNTVLICPVTDDLISKGSVAKASNSTESFIRR